MHSVILFTYLFKCKKPSCLFTKRNTNKTIKLFLIWHILLPREVVGNCAITLTNTFAPFGMRNLGILKWPYSATTWSGGKLLSCWKNTFAPFWRRTLGISKWPYFAATKYCCLLTFLITQRIFPVPKKVAWKSICLIMHFNVPCKHWNLSQKWRACNLDSSFAKCTKVANDYKRLHT